MPNKQFLKHYYISLEGDNAWRVCSICHKIIQGVLFHKLIYPKNKIVEVCSECWLDAQNSFPQASRYFKISGFVTKPPAVNSLLVERQKRSSK